MYYDKPEVDEEETEEDLELYLYLKELEDFQQHYYYDDWY